jgi:CubicO group peptidase (beta-lactamase class C family)
MKISAQLLPLHDARSFKSGFLAAALGTFTFAAVTCNGDTSTKSTTETVWPTTGWQTSTPEEQGIDSKELAKLIEFGAERFAAGPSLTPANRLESLLVTRHGKIVVEVYYPPYAAGIPHHLYSVTKAVIGTLTGIALKDGLLDSTDHRVLQFFDGRKIANLDQQKEAMTVQNLLDMTSGIQWTQPLDESNFESAIEMLRSSDWVQFVLDRPMAAAPGDTFNYSNGNTHLLSAIITKITGMSAEDYAKEKLFGPLGITNIFWQHDPQGFAEGGDGLFLLPRDMAKIGYLYLRDGNWEGKQLLPPTWIERISHAAVRMTYPPRLLYSNLFWAFADKHIYMAVGHHNQVIMVFPELDVVAVTTGRATSSLGELADLISSSVKSNTSLPVDEAGTKLLADKIVDVSTEKRSEVGRTAQKATSISGKIYKFPPNTINVKSLSLDLTDPHPRFEMQAYTTDIGKPAPEFTGPIGLDGLYRRGELTYVGLGPRFQGAPRVNAVKGNWQDDRTFVLDRQILGLGLPSEQWTLTFDGDRINVAYKFGNAPEVSIDGQAGG